MADFRRRHFFAVLAVSLTIVGCSGGSDPNRKPTHPVSGTVKMGDAPVGQASVTFSPVQGQPVATARTDAEGKFTLTTYEAGDGAAAGNYKVLVSKSGGSPAKESSPQSVHDAISTGGPPPSAHSGPSAPGDGSSLPQQYAGSETTPLTATVEEGKENVFDFQLEP
ncbi:MAG: carboxypeptidase regulatory-like domain-containing protein [Planctomycetaceae bacterium]|nr:carboxypeptidase regulatory-like domain-containing protein [Planctomycetaceae bacterium]